jgi:uncharacterized protein (DUF2236 family)
MATLPRPLRRRLESGLSDLLRPAGSGADDFLAPAGEPALLASDSVSWQVFKNPLAVFVGGVAAVVLELAEPRVRSGVWEHTTFRERPLDRLRGTGYATMMTVYGPRSRAEAMIAGVNQRHAQVRGHTPEGQPYCATDAELLDWVRTTACFGFLEAYHAYAAALDGAARDRFYAEGKPAAALYGASATAGSQAEQQALFERLDGQLRASPTIFEFLRIVRRMPALPAPLRPLQGLLVQASVQLIPRPLRERLDLGRAWDLAPWQDGLVRRAAAAMNRLVLATHPAVQACRRLGLPDDHLYAHA